MTISLGCGVRLHTVPNLCSASAVLRALALVHGALAVALLAGASSLTAWVLALAEAAWLAVPVTLTWMLGMCAARGHLARLGPPLQTLAVSVYALALTVVLASAQARWLGLRVDGVAGAAGPGLVAAALAGAFYAFERNRARAAWPAAAAAQLADLRTRIRPHFLFNTLNTAMALVQDEPRQAERVLEDLSELFRAALGALDGPSTLGEEIALARRYLAIEQLRFGERLQVSWDVDESVGAARLPPLALQPLVENAVRHGVEASREPVRIEVRTRRLGERALVSVTNTVPADAIPAPGGHGLGLASVRERLRLLHDLEADLRLGPTADGRWRVAIGVPL